MPYVTRTTRDSVAGNTTSSFQDLSSIIYGMTWLQVYLYYTQHSSKDSISLKIFVGVLIALDSLHLALLGHGLYIVLVTNFGNYLADRQAPWTLVVQSVIGVVISTCIQYFYAVRVFRFRNIHSGIRIIQDFVSVSTPSFIVFSDASHTAIRKQRASARSNLCGQKLKKTNAYSMAERVFAAACLITYVKYPNTLIYAPFFFILVRLYPCSFLTILNSRVHIRSRLRGCGGNTSITINQEQVTDGDPLATSRLHINPNEDVLAMINMTKQKRPGTVERTVVLDGSTTV
ncbi:hypothetical protein F5888DRAFT_1868366 [Russula emetica]|nr:hypothetical protein F5888DRAFT_1868366 [Russula emetica]